MEAAKLTRVVCSENKDESTVGTRLPLGAGKAAVAAARAKGNKAIAMTLLNLFQKHLVLRCGKQTLSFCKAVVRLYAAEDFLYGSNTIVDSWVPAPKKLDECKADELLVSLVGCVTPGRGLLGEGVGGGSTVLEPPILSATHLTVRDGLFGVYETMRLNFQDWLSHLARILGTQRS